MPIYFWLTPMFVLFMALETYWYPRLRGRPYPWRASVASLAVYAGSVVTMGLHAHLTGPLQESVASHGLTRFPMDRWWHWVLLFLVVEGIYYWCHRLTHLVRWGWATHAVHHSAQQITFAAAGRLEWTYTLTGVWLLYLPLFWIGIATGPAILIAQLNLVYQFFLHSELCPKLGPLEWILNTPSNHRVHHAINPCYIGRNFGGVTMLYDRLFGTYAAEREEEPCEYGLLDQVHSYNPLRLVFHEWSRLARDLRRSRSLREALGYLVLAPGWRPATTPAPAPAASVRAG